MATEVVKITGADEFLTLLKKLPPELVSKRGGPVLVGLRRGGNSMRKSWREEIKRIIEEPNIGGVYLSTETYAKSIAVIRMRRPQRVGANEAVRVTVKPGAVYPNGTRVALVAGVLEYGREDMPAKAPIRKAFEAGKQKALESVVKGINDGIKRAIKKLESTANK